MLQQSSPNSYITTHYYYYTYSDGQTFPRYMWECNTANTIGTNCPNDDFEHYIYVHVYTCGWYSGFTETTFSLLICCHYFNMCQTLLIYSLMVNIIIKWKGYVVSIILVIAGLFMEHFAHQYKPNVFVFWFCFQKHSINQSVFLDTWMTHLLFGPMGWKNLNDFGIIGCFTSHNNIHFGVGERWYVAISRCLGM